MQKKSAYFLLVASVIPISMFYTNCSAPFGVSSDLSQSSIAGGGGSGSSGDSSSGSGSGSGGVVSPVTTSTAAFKDPFVPAKTVTVCATGCDYTKPSLAFAAAQDKWLIKITAGSYVDCGTLPSGVANIWVKGVGGMAHMSLNAGTVACQKKGIIVADSANVTIDNMELSGAAISDDDGSNGAGIRFEGTNMDVRNSDFHDNQNGILTNASSGAVTIRNSHFARNGIHGYEHDMYIGHVASFSIENSIVEQGFQGNVVKTRSSVATISCNQIINGYDTNYMKNGYLIDLSNGGEVHILNNTLGQGPYTNQKTLVQFGAEGLVNPTQSLEVKGNLLLNDFGGGVFISVFNPPTAPAMLTGNTFVGGGANSSGSATETGSQSFVNRAAAGVAASGFPRSANCPSSLGLLTVN